MEVEERRSICGWTLISAGLVAAAGITYYIGRLVGDRMVAAGNGFEMAFYLSPLVFYAIDAFLAAAVSVSSFGLLFGRPKRSLPLVILAMIAVAGFLLAPS